MNYFVTGTDTGVGKTFVTALLTRALRKAGFDTVALKPMCCGSREDVEILQKAGGRECTLDEINPLWFEAPAAPLVAARKENRAVDLGALKEWYQAHRQQRRSLLVEGAGGWLVPVAENKTVADLAEIFDLPVLVVVSNKLGCLNHTLLTVDNIQSRGLQCAGLVLNTLTDEQSLATETNKRILQEFSKLPILFEIRPGQRSLELAVA